MNTVYLLRHAKSSWADVSLDDHDRPLQDKGRQRAAALAEILAGRDLSLDRVVCSTAARARQTLEIVAPALGKPEVSYDPVIYGGGFDDIVALLNRLPEQVESIMLVGHDPLFQQLAGELPMTARGDALDRVRRKFPTAGLAVISFGGASWPTVGRRMGHLEEFLVAPDP